MADPISITGLVISVGQVLGALCTIGGQLYEAASEIQTLYCQFCALKGVLEEVQRASTGGGNSQIFVLLKSEEFNNAFKMCQNILHELLKDLQPLQGSLKKVIRITLWPIKLPAIQSKAGELEKIKTLLVLAMMTCASLVI
jgi:hypothetical protein